MVHHRLWMAAFLVLVSSLILVAFPGDEPLDLHSLSDADLETVAVRFERQECYGTCPAYTVTIHGDGHVEYVGKKHVKVVGAQEGRVDIATVRALLSEFARVKFFSLPEQAKCKGSVCTDMATVVTELKVKGITHVVRHYYGCGGAPKALFDLETAVDKFARTEQWTGDVSRTGPFGTTCVQVPDAGNKSP